MKKGVLGVVYFVCFVDFFLLANTVVQYVAIGGYFCR